MGIFSLAGKIATCLANLWLKYCIVFVTCLCGLNLICLLFASPPHPALCLVLHAASKQCFKSLHLGFACLTEPNKDESAISLSILLNLIKAFSLMLMEIQSSSGMLLQILGS